MTKELETHKGWAKRENKDHKIEYTQIPPQMLKRLAYHYTEWGKVHWAFNRLKWDRDYQEDMKKSAFRHFMSWIGWEHDEDHMSALIWNMFSYETLQLKQEWWLDNYMEKILVWLKEEWEIDI